MYEDFKKHADLAVGYERYRQEVQKMNISFTALGHEECDVCKIQHIHAKADHQEDGGGSTCSMCKEHAEHIQRTREGRREYRKDADRQWDDDEVAYSADLTKISLNPILPHKVAVFTPRLIAFNETIAPAGEERRQKDGARNATRCAVARGDGGAGHRRHRSGLLGLSEKKRNITPYADNCSAQNKSWVLITVLLTFVNQPDNATEVIILKSLEPGHTSMSADAAHQLVQKKLFRAKEVCDFRDFADLVEASGMQVEVLSHRDFPQFQDGMGEAKLALLGREGLRPYLRSVGAIKVKRGSQIFLKTAHGDTQWRAFHLLKPFYDASTAPDSRQQARGVNKGRIGRICQAQVPLMVPHKRRFWLQLQEEQAGKNVRDLTGWAPTTAHETR